MKRLQLNLPTTLYGMLFRGFFYWFAIIQGLFVVILVIFDLFGKLDTYMNNSVPMWQILFITVLYIPKAISMTIPVAVMFGATMTLGTFYQNNELVAIFTSQVSMTKFTMPLIIFNMLLSVGLILFDSFVVIPANRYRDEKYEQISDKRTSGKTDNENLTIRSSEDQSMFWSAQKFVSSKNMLEKVKIFKIDDDFKIKYRLDADKAVYTKNGWLFQIGIEREWDATGDLILNKKFQKKYVEYTEKPTVFRKAKYDIENMTILEARETVMRYKQINIEHNKELTNYYKKFSFPFTLFIVSLFALGVSTISKTNVLIISLFFSIGLAVIFYCLQMFLDILATTGRIPPIVGAWLPMILFTPVGIILIQRAKT